MKKLLFATALLTALFLSACGSQKADSNDLANQPATRPEEGAELDPEFSVDDEDTGETAEPQPDAELSEMVDAIYNVQPVDLMGMETVAIDACVLCKPCSLCGHPLRDGHGGPQRHRDV